MNIPAWAVKHKPVRAVLIYLLESRWLRVLVDRIPFERGQGPGDGTSR